MAGACLQAPRRKSLPGEAMAIQHETLLRELVDVCTTVAIAEAHPTSVLVNCLNKGGHNNREYVVRYTCFRK